MSIRNFQCLCKPRSVAVIGASQKLHNVGASVLRYVLNARFTGQIFPVNPTYNRLERWEVFANINHLSATADLALMHTPSSGIHKLIADCRRHH